MSMATELFEIAFIIIISLIISKQRRNVKLNKRFDKKYNNFFTKPHAYRI